MTDSSLQLSDLTELILSSGHKVGVGLIADRKHLSLLGSKEYATIDAWVVRLNFHTELGQLCVEGLESLAVPVIYDDVEQAIGMDAGERIRRFQYKIHICTGEGVSISQTGKRAKEVWVLAASTGGVEAVLQFLKNLPDSVVDVAFLYVQHIDANMIASLHKAVRRSTSWSVMMGDKSCVLCERCVVIVSPTTQFELSSVGALTPTNEEWGGHFKPSIDQVMAKVARIYGAQAGAIIFSGMGDDGSKSCHYMKHSGGCIWAQSPVTCAVDSMPVSAQATGCVSNTAEASRLASQFASRHELAKMTGDLSV